MVLVDEMTIRLDELEELIKKGPPGEGVVVRGVVMNS